MIWCAVIITGQDTGAGAILIQSPDNQLWRKHLNPITTKTVTAAVAKIAGTTTELTKLRESPRRRNNGMTLFEFIVFDNSPAPF